MMFQKKSKFEMNKILKTNNKILVIGSSNTDMVIYTDHFPHPGETILGGRFLMNPGGKGANQAVASARLGGNVVFFGKIGKDIFGQEAIKNLEKESIDVSLVLTDPENSSGIAQIIVNKDAGNCITVAPGANMDLREEDVDYVFAQISDMELLLLQLEIPLETIVYAAKLGHQMGKKVILNPAPATTLPNELYSHLYMITPNETEAEFLAGVKITDKHTAIKAAQILKNKGVEIVIITMGEKGALVCTETMNELIPAPQVKAIDTTAAGDTFNGALAVALIQGNDLLSSVRFANQAASIAVTRAGAQSSIPFINELTF